MEHDRVEQVLLKELCWIDGRIEYEQQHAERGQIAHLDTVNTENAQAGQQKASHGLHHRGGSGRRTSLFNVMREYDQR